MTIALTIAGSDSGGGAGIQADLKTFCAHGVYGTTVITALTAQNTLGVTAIHPVPPRMVAEQYRQVVTDLAPQAAKTGMLAQAPIIEALAEVMAELPVPNLVVDPVMVSKTGAPLLEPEAVSALIALIVPGAALVTPNLHEAASLAEMPPLENLEQMRAAARRIREQGPVAVLVKGGHLPAEQEAIDLLWDGRTERLFRAPRQAAVHTHGTGCTYSAAIAALLSRGADLPEAIERAKRWIGEAIRTAPGLGRGVGPLNHFAATD